MVLSSPKACDVLLRTPGASLDLFLQDKGNREFKLNDLKKTWITTSFVFTRCMERASFFKLFRCWLRDFVYLVVFFPGNENLGGSAMIT